MGKQSRQEKSTTPKLNGRKKTNLNRKKPWSEKQDKLLIKMIQKHGPSRWSVISRSIPGRQGKQCRERWHNHLNPEIKKQGWETKEEWILFLAYHLYQSKWAYMTELIPRRTDNTIKNHWNSGMKKRIVEFQEILQGRCAYNIELVKDKKTSYLNQFCQDEEYLQMQTHLMNQIYRKDQDSKQLQLAEEEKMNESNENHSILKIPANLFQPEASNVLGPSNKPFIEQNASNIKDSQCEDHQQLKIMRLNSILSDRKDRFNYSMMFETPPKKKFGQGYQEAIDSSKPQLIVEEIFLEGANQNIMQSPSKFIMM